MEIFDQYILLPSLLKSVRFSCQISSKEKVGLHVNGVVFLSIFRSFNGPYLRYQLGAQFDKDLSMLTESMLTIILSEKHLCEILRDRKLIINSIKNKI